MAVQPSSCCSFVPLAMTGTGARAPCSTKTRFAPDRERAFPNRRLSGVRSGPAPPEPSHRVRRRPQLAALQGRRGAGPPRRGDEHLAEPRPVRRDVCPPRGGSQLADRRHAGLADRRPPVRGRGRRGFRRRHRRRRGLRLRARDEPRPRTPARAAALAAADPRDPPRAAGGHARPRAPARRVPDDAELDRRGWLDALAHAQFETVGSSMPRGRRAGTSSARSTCCSSSRS